MKWRGRWMLRWFAGDGMLQAGSPYSRSGDWSPGRAGDLGSISVVETEKTRRRKKKCCIPLLGDDWRLLRKILRLLYRKAATQEDGWNHWKKGQSAAQEGGWRLLHRKTAGTIGRRANLLHRKAAVDWIHQKFL